MFNIPAGNVSNQLVGPLGRALKLPIPDRFFVVINGRQIELFAYSISIGKPIIVIFQQHLVEAAGIATGIYYRDKLIPWGDGPITVQVGDILKANFNLTSNNNVV